MTDQSKPFYLLGAGFSKAVNPVMPVLPELAEFVLREMGLPMSTLDPFDESLEQWLSHISADQPWLPSEENLRNRAHFQVASRQVFRCIREAETRVFEQARPSWLGALVDYWCDAQAHVASFNYDVIVEKTAQEIQRVTTWTDLYAIAITVRRAVSSGFSLGTMPPRSTTLSMYKLHGSTSWLYGGLDSPPSEPVVLDGRGFRYSADDETDRGPVLGRNKSLYDDVEPLIVPPTGSKGVFYGNRALRAQWRSASEKLRSASELVVMGYSFPPSDLAARHFISTSVADAGVPVTVVDRNCDVADTVQSLLPKGVSVTSFYGDDAVSDYIRSVAGDHIEWGASWKGGRLVPQVRPNGEPYPMPRRHDEEYPDPRNWLQSEVLEQWPEVLDRVIYLHVPPRGPDGEGLEFAAAAYTPGRLLSGAPSATAG